MLTTWFPRNSPQIYVELCEFAKKIKIKNFLSPRQLYSTLLRICFCALFKLVQGVSQALNSLIQTRLNLRANHHAHHHVELGVEHHADTCVALGNLLKLNPESKVDRNTTLVGNNLNMLILNAFLDAHANLHALSLERAAVGGSLPLLYLLLAAGSPSSVA